MAITPGWAGTSGGFGGASPDSGGSDSWWDENMPATPAAGAGPSATPGGGVVAPGSPGTAPGGSSGVTFGGGWSDPWAQTGGAQALQAALNAGIPLEQAPEWIKQHYPGLSDSGAYYATIGSSGRPGIAFSNYYTAYNPNGGIDLISRPSGGGGGGAGGFGSLNFTGQGGTFTPPTLEEVRNSPGYQFALEQGLQGVQRGAAAKGTLLTGGTLKALQQYGTGLADQTYGNAFQRALASNTTNFGQALDVNRTNYGNLYNLANLGFNAANSTV